MKQLEVSRPPSDPQPTCSKATTSPLSRASDFQGEGRDTSSDFTKSVLAATRTDLALLSFSTSHPIAVLSATLEINVSIYFMFFNI